MVVVRTHKFRVPAFRHVYKIVCLARILEPHQGNTRCETEVITGRVRRSSEGIPKAAVRIGACL
jgi:hypothetical protein